MKISHVICAVLLAGFVALDASGQEQPKAGKKAAKAAASLKLPENVRVEENIVYAKYGARELMLDMYLPKTMPASAVPCIVVIHGGGWQTGDKQRFARHAAYLAEQGFAAACIGYRLMPEVTIAECVEDSKAAVRWVRANAARFNIDPDWLGTIGGSAGGQLVTLLGTSATVQKLEGHGGNPGVSSRVQAVVAMAPVTDFNAAGLRRELDEEMGRRLSPVTYVDAKSAPLLLLHGDADKLVPLEQSEMLLAKYKAAGATAELFTVKGGAHGFWTNGAGFTDTMERATAFFRQKLK
jgi:acetyl esterase/lipase